MQIDVNEHRQIRLKDVFEPIELVSTEGESLIICMRDGGFEIAVQDLSQKPDSTQHFHWYRIRSGIVEPIAAQDGEQVIK